MPNKINFGLYGSGWRAEFFLRVAKLLPNLFHIDGVITRNPQKQEYFTKEFGVKCYSTLGDMLKNTTIDFMVLSVSGSVSTDIAIDLLNRGIPTLLETPPAQNLQDLIRLHNSIPKNAKVQVAEQYPFQPMHCARKKFINTGKLGSPSFVQISNTHAYHAVALTRHYLGIGFENVDINATSFQIPVVAGFMRDGLPPSERIDTNKLSIVTLDFGGKIGLINHEGNQHRSWVRSSIIHIKGERGEILNDNIKYLKDFKSPVETSFARKDLGREDNFEGVDLKGIFVHDELIYKNPFPASRLTDDEMAIASMLENMSGYIKEEIPPYYPLSQGLQDMYIALEIERAMTTNSTITTITQPWA